MPNEITAIISQIGPSTSEARFRQHTVLVDRPEAKGGADQGPMGGELFLAAIGGCFMSNLLAAIRARDAPVSHARVTVVGELAESPTRYKSVDLNVSADCEDGDLLAKLVEIADRGCIMTNTVRGAIELNVRVA
jgi:putative redox protein